MSAAQSLSAKSDVKLPLTGPRVGKKCAQDVRGKWIILMLEYGQGQEKRTDKGMGWVEDKEAEVREVGERDNRQQRCHRWRNVSRWGIWFSTCIFSIQHLLSVGPCEGASGCLFLFDLHNHTKYSVFKNHPFIDIDMKGQDSEGIFPKLFSDYQSSKDASPGLLAPMMVLSPLVLGY